MSKQLTIDLVNVGPHERLSLVFEPGVNVLRGKNGVGKSTAIAAASSALGAPADVTVRDGSIAGTVTVDGHVALHIGKRTLKNGSPTVEIGSVSPIHDIIDPGIKDPEKRDSATIKAILAMAPVAVDEKVIAELTGGDDELRAVPLPADAPNNVLAVAEHFRRAAHSKALEKQKEAERNQGVADAASHRLSNLPLPQTVNVTVAEAEDRVRATREKAVAAELMGKQRREAEERHTRIKASLTEMPDASETGPAAVKLAQLKATRFAAAKAVADLKLALAAAESDLKGVLLQEEDAKIAWEEVCKAAKQWEAHTRALQEPITGPSDADVNLAKSEADNAVEVAKAAHAASERKRVQDEMALALVQHETALERSKELRDLAHGVSEALGRVLAAHGLDGFDVEERRLFYKLDGKRLLFAERMSFGQRCRVALTIALKAYQGRFVPLDPAFWTSLQPKFQKEMAAQAKEMGVVLVSEEATDDDVISVARVEGAINADKAVWS